MNRPEKILYLTIFLAGLAFGAYINEAKSTELDKFYIEAEKAVLSNRHYELNDIHARDRSLNLGFNVKFNEDWYWNNRIESTIGKRKFDQIAWRFEFGLWASENVEVYFGHYSSHTLDNKQYRVLTGEKISYPEMNSIGIRWYIK